MGELSLWVEKYRPRSLDQAILPFRIQKEIVDLLATGEIPNMIFEGPPGTGKTTVARAICDDLKADYIVINGSDESGIDTLRGKVRNFASSMSLTSDAKHKVVIFDEADYLNANSTQPALRGFIEEFSTTCRFIFTCNYKSRILPAIHSRTAIVSFNYKSEELPELAAGFFRRCCSILAENKVSFENATLAAFIKRFFPDMRRCLNELQRYSASGAIDSGILSAVAEAKIGTVVKAMKEKNFADIRKFFAENSDISSTEFFTSMYKALCSDLEKPSIPAAILILADYQYKSAFAVSQEINLVACCVSIMMECKFT